MASIRLRKDEDLAACVEVMKAVYETSGYPVAGVDNAAADLQTDDLAWVAEDGEGSVIGHVALKEARTGNVGAALWWELHPGANIAVLGHLFVHPRSRGAGAGSRLVRTAEEEARRKGQRLIMFALVKDQDAIRLYRRLGWEHYGSVIYRWGEGNAMAAECFASPVS
ncbi:acyl-CoA N-acyltransferase [Xylariaceae sp. FL1651]|nr:acyl-CoA N-acyltransferase [Xylariaceae sp. FL1651]